MVEWMRRHWTPARASLIALAALAVAAGSASAEAAGPREPGPATSTGAAAGNAVSDTATRSTRSIPSLVRVGEESPRRLVYYGRLGMPFVPRPGIIVFSSVPIIEPVIVRRLDTSCHLDESDAAAAAAVKRRAGATGND